MVWTSSTSSATAGAGPVVHTRGGEARRAARVRPTWRGPSALDRQRSCGRRVSAASCEAISSAGSKPRRRSREVAGGTGTTVPPSTPPGAPSAMRRAISRATGSRLRNFSATTSSLATPSWGAAAQAASRPGGPAATGGRVACSERSQRRQSRTAPGQPAPQAAQRGGASSERSCRSASTPSTLCRRGARVARQLTRLWQRTATAPQHRRCVPCGRLSRRAWRRPRRPARSPGRPRSQATTPTP